MMGTREHSLVDDSIFGIRIDLRCLLLAVFGCFAENAYKLKLQVGQRVYFFLIIGFFRYLNAL